MENINELKIPASKIKKIFDFFAGVVSLGGITFLMISDKNYDLWPLVLIFFGGFLITFLNLITESYLFLSESGLKEKDFFGTHFYNWKDIECFYLVRVKGNLFGTSLRFNLVSENHSEIIGLMRRVIPIKTVYLSTFYTRSSFDLVNLLNEWREKYSQ